MKLLTSHKFAVALTALVVLFSVFFGCHRSLTAVRNRALDVFEHGAVQGHSISADLQAQRDTAANLHTVAAKYPGVDSGDLAALSSDSQDQLLAAADRVFAALEQAALSEKDAQYVAGFRAELSARSFSIAHDPYNDLARSFNDETLRAFPVSLLRPALFIDELPLYN